MTDWLTLKNFIKVNLPSLIPIKRKLWGWGNQILNWRPKWLPREEGFGLVLTVIFTSILGYGLYRVIKRRWGKAYAYLSLLLLFFLPVTRLLIFRQDYFLPIERLGLDYRLTTSGIGLTEMVLGLAEKVGFWIDTGAEFYSSLIIGFAGLGLLAKDTDRRWSWLLLVFLLASIFSLVGVQIWVVWTPLVIYLAMKGFTKLWQTDLDFFWWDRGVLVLLLLLFVLGKFGTTYRAEKYLWQEQLLTQRLRKVSMPVTELGFWSVGGLGELSPDQAWLLKTSLDTRLTAEEGKKLLKENCLLGWQENVLLMQPRREGCNYFWLDKHNESIILGNKIELIDYQLKVGPTGKLLDLTALWHPLRDIKQDYRVFFHLVGPMQSQTEQGFLRGWLTTSNLAAEQTYLDEYQLEFANVEPGNYVLAMGLYGAPGKDVLVNQATGETFVRVGTVSVR